MSEAPAKALVLVHGFLGASNNWLTVSAKLRTLAELQGWRIFCPDLKWHGGDPSRFADDGVIPTTQAVAEHLANQLAQISETQLVLLGHSFGLRPLVKILAQKLLPTKEILALVAEDSSPEISDHGTDLLNRVLRATPVPFVSREAAREYFDSQFGAGSALARFLLSNVRQDDERGGHTWRFPHQKLIALLDSAAAESLASDWEAIPTRVLMMVGDRSEHLPPERAKVWRERRVARGLPTELLIVENAGHWVHSDQPESFALALAKFVKVFNYPVTKL